MIIMLIHFAPLIPSKGGCDKSENSTAFVSPFPVLISPPLRIANQVPMDDRPLYHAASKQSGVYHKWDLRRNRGGRAFGKMAA